MFAVWLLLNAVMWSPDLHHRLHENSGDTGHDCLITQMASGHLPVDFTEAIGTALPAIFSESLCIAECHCDFDSAHRLPASCGPPSAARTTAAG